MRDRVCGTHDGEGKVFQDDLNLESDLRSEYAEIQIASTFRYCNSPLYLSGACLEEYGPGDYEECRFGRTPRVGGA